MFARIDPVWLLYGLFVVVAITTLWQWHRSGKYDSFSLLDLVADDGKLSSRKFMEFGTWVVMTIGFVLLVEKDRMTEWYMTAYGLLFIGARTAGQFIHAKKELAEAGK